MATGTLDQTFEFAIEGVEFASATLFNVPSLHLTAKLEKGTPPFDLMLMWRTPPNMRPISRPMTSLKNSTAGSYCDLVVPLNGLCDHGPRNEVSQFRVPHQSQPRLK